MKVTYQDDRHARCETPLLPIPPYSKYINGYVWNLPCLEDTQEKLLLNVKEKYKLKGCCPFTMVVK